MEDLRPKVTVEELEYDVTILLTLREQAARKEKELKEVKAEMSELQDKLRGKLESLEMDSYKGKAGSFSFRPVEGFRVPKDLETKKRFFTFLEEKGIFDELVSVNANTLNSWAQAEIEAAAERGDFDFQIPGLEKAQPRMKYTMTQGKGKK